MVGKVGDLATGPTWGTIMIRIWGLRGLCLLGLVSAGLVRHGTAAESAINSSDATKPVRSVSPTATEGLDAAGVDALLADYLAEVKTTPVPLAGDEEFLRRVYLDVAGVLPTPSQALEFRRDHSADKRARLIDHLVDGRDASRNWARFWRDVMKFRATNENLNQVRFPILEDWLADQYAKNIPWDKVATNLITATGIIGEDGATTLTAAHDAKPVELAGEVSRIFMGIQIQCAECHDHPTDSWKREQFHEFAAFFAGSRLQVVKPANEAKPEPTSADGKKEEAKGEKAKAKPVKKAPRIFQVTMKGVPKYTMPDKADPKKMIPVEPRFFLASVGQEKPPSKLSSERRHELIASYITSKDDPWFAKSFVNRTWGLLLGEGFVNPVDDMGPDRVATAPAVLEALATQFRDSGYDVHWLYRTILKTKAYQREFRPSGSSAGKVPFAANVAGRLRSDQVLDVLSQALDAPMDAPRPGAARLAKAAGAKGMPKAAAFLRNSPRNVFNTLFGVDPSTPVDDVTGTIPQSLFLMNGQALNRAIEARPGTMLGQILDSHPDNQSALEAVYLRVLARRPSTREVEVCDRHLTACHFDRKVCFEDILWTLVNSTEFLSRR